MSASSKSRSISSISQLLLSRVSSLVPSLSFAREASALIPHRVSALVPSDTTQISNDIPHSRQIDMYMTGARFKAPKNSVILAHGLFGFDRLNLGIMEVHYWRGISEALESIGTKVVITRVGRVSSIPTRAKQLKAQLDLVARGKEVNLIAHSMGGLDARYMISHLYPASFRIATLTTVSTPHRGSPFMDWCRDAFGVGHVTHPAFVSPETAAPPATHPLIRSIFSPLDMPAFSNLTTEYCNQVLNPACPNDPSVRYFSYGASQRISIMHPLGFPYEIVKKAEGDNDGLVSVDSAKWGEYLGTMHCDHWDLTGNRFKPVSELTSWIEAKLKNTKERSRFDAIEFYLQAVTRLADGGY